MICVLKRITYWFERYLKLILATIKKVQSISGLVVEGFFCPVLFCTRVRFNCNFDVTNNVIFSILKNFQCFFFGVPPCVCFIRKRRHRSKDMTISEPNLYICKSENPHIPSICMSSFWPKQDIQLYSYILRSTIFSISVFFATDRKTKCGPKYADVSKESKTRQKRIVYPYFEY